MHKNQTTIIIGNFHKTLGDNKHYWKLYVKNYDDFIERVEIFLHETFNPNHLILKSSPFEFESIGWGVFKIKLIVHTKDNQKHTFIHDLQFDKDDEHKGYEIQTKKKIPILIFQCTTDDPRLMKPLKRWAYELRKKRQYEEKQKMEEETKIKAKGIKTLIKLNYSLKEKQIRRKGSPCRYIDVSIDGGVYKSVEYRTLCGNKRGEHIIQAVVNEEEQEKIINFIKNKVQCSVFNEKVEEQEKKHSMYNITETLSLYFENNSYKIEKTNSKISNQIKILLSYLEQEYDK